MRFDARTARRIMLRSTAPIHRRKPSLADPTPLAEPGSAAAAAVRRCQPEMDVDRLREGTPPSRSHPSPG
jgi:hypothetical protein